MDALSIAAASGMRARLESLDLLANNLANAATNGFKADREFYSLFQSDAARIGLAGPEPAALPVIERNWTDFSQGSLDPSGNPLALALEGPGFFAVETPAGPLYTRNGEFHIDATGTLVNADGYAVRTREEPRRHLVLDPLDTRPVDIRGDGSVWREGERLGTLEVSGVDPAHVNKRPGGYFRLADGGVVQPSTAQVHQGRVERSNTSPSESAVRLISVMRQFEMLQRAVAVGTEMNRRATDEVARTGS